MADYTKVVRKHLDGNIICFSLFIRFGNHVFRVSEPDYKEGVSKTLECLKEVRAKSDFSMASFQATSVGSLLLIHIE